MNLREKLALKKRISKEFISNIKNNAFFLKLLQIYYDLEATIKVVLLSNIFEYNQFVRCEFTQICHRLSYQLSSLFYNAIRAIPWMSSNGNIFMLAKFSLNKLLKNRLKNVSRASHYIIRPWYYLITALASVMNVYTKLCKICN